MPLIDDWLDPETETVRDAVAAAIESAEPGAVLMLQNTRKYDIERVLWKAKESGPSRSSRRDCPPFRQLDLPRRSRHVYVNEALSAG